MAISRISDRKQSLRTFTGVQKGSVYFDGSGDYITTPSTGAFQLEKDFTVECWVYPLSFSGSPTIWCAGTETTNRFITALNTSGQITTNLYGGSTTTYTGVIALNQWTHLAWVRLGGKIKLYINGTASTTTETQTGTLGNGTFRIGADTSGAAGFLGYMSNFRIVKDVAAYFGNFMPSVVPLSFDTTTASGFFNGGSNYLDVPSTNNTNFDWVAGNTTIETWIFPTSVSGYKSIISKNSLNNTNNDWDFYLDSTGKLNWFYWNGGVTTLTSTTAVTLNTWSHVAFVYNRSSQQINLFINGANTAGAAYIPTRDLNTSSLKIGASNSGVVGSTIAYFSGYMSQFRIVQNDSPVLYSSNFTPSLVPLTSIPGTKLLTLQSSTIKDNSPTKQVINTNGTIVAGLSATSDGYYSHYFDGSGDYAIVNSPASFTLGSGDFTLELWIYPTLLIQDNKQILDWRPAAGATTQPFLELRDISSVQQVWFRNSSYVNGIVTGGPVITNAWNHIAVTRLSGVVRLFLNGALKSEATNTDTFPGAPNRPYIGTNDAASSYYTGYINNLRVVVGTAVYTQTFDPPRLPLQPTQALVDPRLRPEISKSIYFDGTGDLVSTPSSSSFAFGTGDWTTECWVLLTKTSYCRLWYFSSDNDNIDLNTNSTPGQISYYNGSTSTASSMNIPMNTWAHIAVVRSVGTVRVYLNGITVITQSTTPNTSARTFNLSWSADTFGGFISNLRMVKGQSVYRGNTFVVPAAPLEISQTPSANIAALYNYPTIPSTGYSTYFDGTGDYITGASPNLGGTWTIEFWMYPTVNATQTTMVSFNAGSFSGINIWRNTSNQLVIDDGANAQTAGTAVIATNAWSHIAISRSGTTTRAYVNGVLALTNTFTPSTVNTVMIGRYNASPWYYYTGYISNFRLINGQALYTSEFLPDLTPLTKFGSLNSSTNNNVLGITTIPEKGYSAYFDGSGDYLSIPSNSAFQFGTGDFTIECWFYDTGTSDTYPGIISSANGWQDGSTALRFNHLGNRKFGFFHNPTGDPIFSSTNTFLSYQWYHVAVTRSGTSMKMFVNGVEEASSTVSASISLDTTTGVFIGSGFDGSSKIKGYISNVRVVKGTAVYTAAFTPSTTPLTAIANTSLLTCQSNTFIDSSANAFTISQFGDTKIFKTFSPFGNTAAILTLQSSTIVDNGEDNVTLTVNGDTLVSTATPFTNTTVLLTAQSNAIVDNSNYRFTLTTTGDAVVRENSPFGTITGELINTIPTNGNSVYFDGSGDYLSVPHNTALDLSTGAPNWTIEAWYNISALTSGSQVIMSKDWQSGSTNASYAMSLQSNGQFFYFFGNGTSGAYSQQYLYTIPGGRLGVWNHVAMARSGSNILCFFNGTLVQTIAITGTLVDAGNPVRIGSTNNPSEYVLGFISNARIVKGQAVYTGNFTVPTAPLAITQTAAANVAAVVNTIPDNGYSAYFDGTGDYLTLNGSSNYAFGTSDFTLEAWIYTTTTSAYKSLFDTSAAGDATATGRFLFDVNTGGYLRLYTDAGTTQLLQSPAGTIIANRWHHVAISRTASVGKMFVDGNQVANGFVSTNFLPAVNRPQIGANGYDASANWSGYISNLRAIKGTGIYQGNFTRPTVPFTTYQAPSANVIQAGVPSGGSSIYFDGSGDYVRAGPLQGGLGAGDFTVEGWVRLVSDMRGNDGIFHISEDNFSPSNSRGVALSRGSGVFGIYFNNISNTPAGTFNIGQWYHFALTRANTSSRLFINGVLTQGPYTDTTNYTTANYVSLGHYYNTGYTMNGYISNFRIVQGNALYTTTFTPSTSPLSITANANTLLLIQDSFTDVSSRKLDVTKFGDVKILADSSPFGNIATLLTLQSPTFSDSSSNSIANLFTVYGDTLMVKTESPFGVSNVKILTAQANAIPNSNLVIDNASGFKITKFGNTSVTLVESPFGYANTKLLTLQSLFPIDKSAANNTITLVGDARANVLANVSNPFRVHNIIPSNVSLLTLNGNTIIDTGVTNSGGPWALTVTGDTKTATQSPFAYAIDTSASMTRSYRNKTFTRRAYEKNTKTNRQFMTANGGAFSITTDGTYIYNVHVFLESNTLTVLSAPGAFKDDNRINFLVVGGGGAGGSYTTDPASPYGKAGGGGAGGFVDAIHYVTSNVQYTMVVGGGGARNGPPSAAGNGGGDSSISAPPADTTFNTITGYGGGGGAVGANGGGGGGNGGGAGGPATTGTGAGPGSQPSYGSKFGDMAQSGNGGFGNPGGPYTPAVPKANPTGATGSGGGGAGGNGGAGPNAAGGPGRGYQVGPPATPHPYTATYAGGGGGAPGGPGGSGGGAPGRNSPNPAPTNGSGGVNLGGGGGGGHAQGPQGPFGSAGGSGIIIAWYKAGIVSK